MRLQEFAIRDFRAARPELHHVHDILFAVDRDIRITSVKPTPQMVHRR
ncbi:MAG TPA: hypothetical protein VHT21_11875 [Stellaceae bacterium]|nr:hypothetical protein [Stellaceae bacterium]